MHAREDDGPVLLIFIIESELSIKGILVPILFQQPVDIDIDVLERCLFARYRVLGVVKERHRALYMIWQKEDVPIPDLQNHLPRKNVPHVPLPSKTKTSRRETRRLSPIGNGSLQAYRTSRRKIMPHVSLPAEARLSTHERCSDAHAWRTLCARGLEFTGLVPPFQPAE